MKEYITFECILMWPDIIEMKLHFIMCYTIKVYWQALVSWSHTKKMLSQNKLSTCSYALNNFSKCIMINGGKCNFLVYSSCHHAHKKSTFIHSVFIYAKLFPFMTLIYEKIIIRETSLTFITVQVFFLLECGLYRSFCSIVFN